MAQQESITDELRTAILEGRFEPGERFVELRLTTQFNCGRGAVRTAMQVLATEGLVELEANRSARVRDVSIREAIQITEARAALETLIAAEAARNADKVQKDALISIGKEMADAVTADDHDTYAVLNGALHHFLREISGHRVAATLVVHLRNRGAHHRYRVESVPGRAKESLAQHQAIIDAVVSGNSMTASKAMADHLGSVTKALKNWSD